LCLFCLLHNAKEVCYLKTYKTKPVCSFPECKELHIKWLHHVMHSLPCKKEVNAGSVNIVHKCKGWRTPEGSWIEMEVADKEAFFVNVLVGDEEEMEDLGSIKRKEEEEEVKLERGVDNHVERRKTTEKKERIKSSWVTLRGCIGGKRLWRWMWMR
jgi:hypothetical protein